MLLVDGTGFRYFMELSMRRESGLLFKENGSKGRCSDLGNIIALCVINDVAGWCKCNAH